MIARSLSRSQPIPFTDPLHERRDAPSRAVRWSPPPPPMSPGSLMAAPAWVSSRHSSAPHSAHEAFRPRAAMPPAPRTSAARQVQARYEGSQPMSVRSSATGRLYRFEQAGQVLSVEADDIALMRRIHDITLL